MLKNKSGDLLGVFHRDDVGDIDLVWGDRNKNSGLDHIIEKHIERLKDFSSAEEAIQVIEDVINNGQIDKKKSKWDKVFIEKDGYAVVISKNVRNEKGEIVNENKNWVVTAFDATISPKRKEVNSSDVTRVTLNTNKGGRAVTSDERTSDSKDSELSQKSKEDAEENKKPRLEKSEGKASKVSSMDALLRDAVVRILRKMGIKVITDNKEAQRVLEEENGRVKAMSFGERYDYKQYPNGRIEPNLSNKEVRIKKADLNHEFSNFDEAKEWAKDNIVRTLDNVESGGKGNVRISGTAVGKYLSESAVEKSDSKDVHLAVLKVLPDVIKESIDVETTPDFEKDENGVRKPGNKINKDVLIHRCYGAVEIDGKIYRVKITLKEYKDAVRDNKAYSYEATKIELLAGTLVGEKNSSNPGTNNSISVAKLLKDVDMTYNPGVKVLEESRKRTDRLREQRVWHGTGSDFEAFDHSYMGSGEGQQVFGWGTYVTEVEGIGRGYAKNYPKKVLTFKGLPIAEMITLQDGRMVSSPERAAYDAIMQEGTVSKAKRFISRIKDMAEEEVMRNLWDDVLNVLSNCKKSDFKQVAQRILYSVEIPDDNGTNYLHWEKPLTKEQQGLIYKLLRDEKIILDLATADFWNGKSKVWNSGSELYNFLNDCFRDHETGNDSQQQASKFLSRAGFTGISYPAQYLSGGRKDGARNYVIFNESDAKIVDKVRFFRTANGEAYGFTVDGKIYLDPTIAGAETAIHEYTHLWATALKNANPKEWSNIVSLMKGTPLWEKIASEYPELTTDDELADEVLAHYSGKRGAERLRKEAESIANGKGSLLDKAGAISALERVKEALTRFWKATADLLHIHFTTAEEVADKVLADLLNGVNPNEVAKDKNTRFQLIGEQGAEESTSGEDLEEVNARFNEELQQQIDGTLPQGHIYQLGMASVVLQSAGLPNLPIELSASRLKDKSMQEEHPFELSEMRGLVDSVQNPLAVFRSATHIGSFVVLTEIEHQGKNFVVAVQANRRQGRIEINSIRSVHYRNKNTHIANWGQ